MTGGQTIADTLPTCGLSLPGVTIASSGDLDVLGANTISAVVVGEVVNGQAQYTQVAALGPEWKFHG